MSAPIYILCIETANVVTSIAIAKNGACIALREIVEPNKAADQLHILVNELLAQTTLRLSDFNAIAISTGPGSYTGLRIAVAAAKGYCFALSIPLIAIPTFETMVEGIQKRYHQTEFDEFVPMIDARRMEVFTSFYDNKMTKTKSFSSLILDETFAQLFDTNKRYIVFGNGATKTIELLKDTSVCVFTEFIHSAQDLCLLSFSHFQNNNFEDVAYYEPNYSKKPYITSKA